jgi:hypothetical protein
MQAFFSAETFRIYEAEPNAETEHSKECEQTHGYSPDAVRLCDYKRYNT